MSDAIHTENARLIALLRRELGLTLAEMGERCGISKSQMHEVERTGRASLPVALALETLAVEAVADFVIKAVPFSAADLNEDVRAARHGLGVTALPAAASTGQSGAMSGRDVAA